MPAPLPCSSLLATCEAQANGGSSALQGKAACKAALQEELGLEQRSEAVVLGFIGRLDEQKGVDVLLEAVPWMVQQVLSPIPTAVQPSV